MEKLIDFDGLFEEKLAQYVRANTGKYSEKQWEKIVPKLYAQFGDVVLPQIKASPKGYYAAMSDEELAEALERHAKEGVRVSDFLCRELEQRKPEALIALLRTGAPEVIVQIAVSVLGGDRRAFDGYFEVFKGELSEEIAEQVVEALKEDADAAKTGALALLREGKHTDCMLDLLSRVGAWDDEVFSALIGAFRECGEDLTVPTARLSRYGDPRALADLLEAIGREDINYAEFVELRCAIEALGGEYTENRDFSEDPAFLAVEAQEIAQAEQNEKK